MTLVAGETKSLDVEMEAAGPQPLTAQEVEDMLQNGVAKSRIMGFVDKFGVDFKLTPSVEGRLRNLGTDDSVLLAIAKNQK